MKKVKLFEEFLNESAILKTKYNGKTLKVDINSIEIEDIDMRDYPDFSDAFIAYAEDDKGNELDSDQIDFLNDEHYDIINELIHDQQLYL